MSNLEPTDVGPAAGGDRPVAEGDRQHVMTLLNTAFAEGLLPAPERDRRLAEARAAVTFDDLVPLTRDLVTGRPAVTYDLAHASANVDQIVAIFGGATRSGRWRVHPETNISAVFGGVELDLSDATFEADELHINVSVLFGGVELVVPEGTEVVSNIGAVFGGTDHHKLAAPRPGLPRIVLSGFALFGGVSVSHPGGRHRDAHRAERHAELHAARAQRHAELYAAQAERHVARAQRHAERETARALRRGRG